MVELLSYHTNQGFVFRILLEKQFFSEQRKFVIHSFNCFLSTWVFHEMLAWQQFHYQISNFLETDQISELIKKQCVTKFSTDNPQIWENNTLELDAKKLLPDLIGKLS